MTPKRSRYGSNTKLADYHGGASLDFLHTELPTLRNVLRKGLLIQEEKTEGGEIKNYSVREINRLQSVGKINCEVQNSSCSLQEATSEQIDQGFGKSD